MIRFLSICNNTFTQTIRQPVYCILVAVTFVLLVMSLPLAGWTMGESGADFQETDQKMLENLGISTLMMSGLLLAAFTASSALSREIEDKTALTVISKPVARATFVLGKFAGVAIAVMLAYYLSTLVFLMTIRHRVVSAAYNPYDFPVIVIGFTAFGVAVLIALLGNFFFGWPFTSAAVWSSLLSLTLGMGLICVIGKGWKIVPFGQDLRPELIVGIFLAFLGVLLFVATAVAASTRLGQVTTLLVCVGVFLLGSYHPFLFQEKGRDVLILRLLGWFSPNLTYFYSMDTLSSRTGGTFPPQLVGLATAYCLLYVAALLAIGVALFQSRSLQEQRSSSALPTAVSLLAWTGRAGALALGLAGMVLLSAPAFYTAKGFVLIGALLLGAVATWLLWGYFARGARWSYWIVVAAAGLGAMQALVALLAADWISRQLNVRINPVLQGIEALVAALVLLSLFLPRTRRHFNPKYQVSMDV